MRIAWVLFALLLLAGVSVICTRPVLSASNDSPDLLYTVAPKYVPLAWMKGSRRFPSGANLFISRGGARHEFLEGFAATADANVSFDGTHVLFAGKKHGRDRWQVWEALADGSNPRQVTSCADDCVRPFYLPEERFVYAHNTAGRFVIEAVPLQGGDALRLIYAPGNYFPTDVLRDGRVLFEAAYPFGSTQPELYTVYSDGSGVESYRCDHGQARHSGHQTSSSDIVFVRSQGLGRFTSALAHEMEIPNLTGDYASEMAETATGDWVLSRRGRTAPHFELVRWRSGQRDPATIVSEPNADIVQPLMLTRRPVPNRHPSALHDWKYANLLCLNAYTSKSRFAEGAIASVRLYSQDSAGRAKLLGSSLVEKDGSFYLRTPADQPLKIELLDASGKTLKKEAGWFWLRRGEQRICVGCHAGPETAPENAVPMVLQRSIVAADMTGASGQAAYGGH